MLLAVYECSERNKLIGMAQNHSEATNLINNYIRQQDRDGLKFEVIDIEIEKPRRA